MNTLIKEILPLVAMFIVAAILIACIANDIDHGIVYTGLAIISGLGGYTVGRSITGKSQSNK